MSIFIPSPHLTGPVTGRQLVKFLCIAPVPCTKRFAPFRVGLLNGHIGIAKPDDFFFTFIASLYNGLFTARNLTLGYVAFHLGLVDLSHIKPP